MYLVSLFEEVVNCRVVKAHLDMFITQHVTYHRRLSQESKKPSQSSTNTDVITMNHNEPIGQSYHQPPLNHPMELIFDQMHPEIQNIDEDMIQTVANRIKEIGDQLEKDKKYQRKMRMLQTVVPATVIIGTAAIMLYRSLKQ